MLKIKVFCKIVLTDFYIFSASNIVDESESKNPRTK